LPYTELNVRSNQACHYDEEPAFTWVYEGTVEGCNRGSFVISRAEKESSGKKYPGKCEVIPELEPETVASI